MKFRAFIFLLLAFQILQAQKEAAHWFFGEFAGVNFNSGIPVAQEGKLATREGCASISDRNGNLLFYTDGSTVYTRNHQIMPNGTDLLGNNSSTQSAIIVPKPGSRSRYYIFTVGHAEKLEISAINHGLNYSEVDMTLNNGFGAVLPENKNVHLITYDPEDALQADWKCSEKLAAIQDREKTGYWVVTHFLDSFYAFKIDDNGVDHQAVISSTDELIPIVSVQRQGNVFANISAIGYLKISPNGKKLGVVHSSIANSPISGRAYLYDFNDDTGIVSNNAIQLIVGSYPYGLEFSSKSSKLYLSTNNYVIRRGQVDFTGSSLYQYDLYSSNIPASGTVVHASHRHHAGALQLGIDSKIYKAKYDVLTGNGLGSLGVIEKPELQGSACDYSDQGVTLLPNTYSNYGLPPFIASTFLLNFQYEFTCLNDLTHFTITTEEEFDSVRWDFGDGNSSDEIEPWHAYESTGSYTVSLVTIQNGIQSDPVTKVIEITERLPVPGEPVEYFECDLVDQDPDDGLTTYNLSLINSAVSLEADQVLVYYYRDLDLLYEDASHAQALPELYSNTERDEMIFAKVMKFNSDCFSVARVILKTNPASNFKPSALISCDNGQNMAVFNLEEHKMAMADELLLPQDTEISFHLSAEEAAYGTNPLEDFYHGREGILYFRVEKENMCFGMGELPVEIYDLPFINEKTSFTFCSVALPAKIDAGVQANSRNLYSYTWQDGQSSHEISISEPGIYHVTIADLASSCSTTKVIEVSSISAPVIEDIEIKEEFEVYSVEVKLSSTGYQPMLSLNEEYGAYQPYGVFEGLNPGSYTVFVKDPFNCSTVRRDFHLFGFPKFMTPNNDGQNDVWEVKGINKNEFTYSRIHIFNRHGKLLATMDPEEHWDGSYMGVELPSDDYWYTMTVTDDKNNTSTYSGHFSIIRK